MLGQLAKGEPPPSGEAAWGKPELLLRCPRSWTFFLESHRPTGEGPPYATSRTVVSQRLFPTPERQADEGLIVEEEKFSHVLKLSVS